MSTVSCMSMSMSISGNLIPAVLRHLGVLWVSDEIAVIIDSGEELPSGTLSAVPNSLAHIRFLNC